jgi:hypothetical protein
MSTDYILSRNVKAEDLFSGCLDAFGIREHITSNRRCLTDGHNYLWAYMSHDGSVSCFSAHGPDKSGKILDAIRELFEIDIFSKHEPQYWGFNTQEEWDAAKNQARNELYADVCAYVRGEPNNIKSGAIGEIAKALVGIDAALLHPENKDKLLAGIDTIQASISIIPF